MDNEEVVRRIETKLKIGKLDSLLLFISSSLSSILTIMRLIIGEYNSIILFIPLLLSGWFMPVYIGYLRGAILLDSTVERIRGWLYLIFGVGFYISLIPFFLLKTTQQEFGIIEIIFALLIGLLILTATIICYDLSFKKALFKIADHNSMSVETKEAIHYTKTAAAIIGAISYLLITFGEWSSIYFWIISVLLYVLVLFYFEGKARYWSKRAEAQK
jgi:hypothetical protein